MIDVGIPKFKLDGQTDNAALIVGFKEEPLSISVQTRNDAGNLYSPANVQLQIWDGLTAGKISEVNAISPSIGLWRGEINIPRVGTWLARWKSADGDVGIQTVVGVDARVTLLINAVRTALDKSLKEKDRTWGYTDADIFMYLTQGLGYFNNIPPVTMVNLGSVPVYMDSMVVDLATLFGIQAQMLYATDTDINYSDQGINLNIDHFTKLGVVYDKVIQRVDTLVKQYKMSFIPGARLIMAYNPERARGYLFSQLLTSGFPYFAIYGMDVSFISRGG